MIFSVFSMYLVHVDVSVSKAHFKMYLKIVKHFLCRFVTFSANLWEMFSIVVAITLEWKTGRFQRLWIKAWMNGIIERHTSWGIIPNKRVFRISGSMISGGSPKKRVCKVDVKWTGEYWASAVLCYVARIIIIMHVVYCYGHILQLLQNFAIFQIFKIMIFEILPCV